MIEVITPRRSLRLFLVASVPLAGFVMAWLLLRASSFAISTAIFAIGMATFVGAGKFATP